MSFRECIASIGTQLDGPENRKDLKRMRSVIKKKITEFEATLKEQKPRSVLIRAVVLVVILKGCYLMNSLFVISAFTNRML